MGSQRRLTGPRRPWRSTRSGSVSAPRRSARRVRSRTVPSEWCGPESSNGGPIGHLIDHRVEECLGTCDDEAMPLSEEEQRILRQIEHELEQDPTFAQRGYRVSRRRSILLVVGLVGGLALTIGGLALNFLFAFAGFVLVLVVAIMLETELRLLGRERLGQLPISAWLSGRRPSGVDDDATR